MPETIANWTSSRLIRFIQEYLANNPLGTQSVMSVDELTVAARLTIADEAEASDQAKAALRERVFQTFAATANVTLSTAYQALPGISYTIPLAGIYVVHANFDFEHSVTGGGFCQGAVMLDGVDQGGNPLLRDFATNARATIGNMWLINGKAQQVITSQAKKTIGAGTATAYGTTSTLVVHKL